MAPTVLHNKEEFDKAIGTKGKYVFIYIHDGTVSEKAVAAAEKYSSSTDSYTVEANESPKVKDYFKISSLPAGVIYKDGSEVEKVDPLTPDNASKIGAVLGA